MEDFSLFDWQTDQPVNPVITSASGVNEPVKYAPPSPMIFPSISGATEEAGGILSTLTSPFRSAWGSITTSVKTTYFYLIGGIALIGILAIVVLGASTRFLKKIEG